MNLQDRLKTIYKANQCTDLNDVNYAIEQIKTVCRQHPDNIAPKRRFASLVKRKNQLTK